MNRVRPLSPLPVRIVAGVTCAAIGIVLGWAVLAIPEDEQGVAPLVAAKMDISGVEHPVTAVLLNFRGYDTLLEIAVLVLAILGVLALNPARPGTWPPVAGQADAVLSALVRFVVPVMMMAAGYLLWAGAHAPGGAFQAGAVLGAAGILLALSGYAHPEWLTSFALRLATAVGFIVFLATAAGVMLAGGEFFEYPVDQAKTLILLIESWLTVSIGAILVILFLATASPDGLIREERGDT